MRNLQLTILVATIAAASCCVAAAQSLVCSAESQAGHVYDKETKSWRPASGKSTEKFVVRKSSNSLATHEVGQLGSATPVAFCEKYFEQDQLRCRGLFQDFMFDRAEMRFIRLYYAGYWNERALKKIAPTRNEGDDAPSVTTGTCAAL